MHRVILIEDDEVIRAFLSDLVNSTGKYLLEHSFASAESAIGYLSRASADDISLMLTDIELPEKNGIDLITWVKSRCPHIQCLVISAYDDADKVFRALKAGATGYVLKSTEPDRLIAAFDDILKGGSPMSSQIARKVVNAFRADVEYADAKEKLSLRENEVLQWLAKGFSYQEIADKLFLSVETVRTHIRNIYEKLQVRNRREALKRTGYY